jgi:hypothetical protein
MTKASEVLRIVVLRHSKSSVVELGDMRLRYFHPIKLFL